MIQVLTADQIGNNWDKLFNIVKTEFPDKNPNLTKLYEDLSSRIMMAPASTRPIYHNAFPGGYVDHVLRVYDFSKYLYALYSKLGIQIGGFTLNELLFCAINHDLGKMGFSGPGNEYYQKNDSEWHIRNQQKYYKTNPDIVWMSLADMSLQLLQEYGVKLTVNEWHAIRVHDGPYEDTNATYFKNFFANGKFKNELPYILMHADLMAMRYEYRNYVDGVNSNGTAKLKSNSKRKKESKEMTFDNIFSNKDSK